MKELKLLFARFAQWSGLLILVIALCISARAQQSAGADEKSLADSVQALRTQVQELQAAVAEIKSEASQYRAESDELRKELESLRAASPPAQANPAPAQQPATSTDQRVASLEETTQVLQSENKTLYQSKVESASKYRARISGLVLFNLFDTRGSVDNIDVPTYAASGNTYGASSTFGATLRQSELGLEVFGPQLAGAKTSGAIQFDFGGGFPSGSLNGVSTGLVRLRAAAVRLDWENTSLVAGQDSLFISPLDPISFASLITPSFGYAGNLWAWTPQVRVEHRFNFSENQNFLLQGGMLDNVTGEPTYQSLRQAQAGESSGQPAYAARISWNSTREGRPMSVGASGYSARENWGNARRVDGWAVATDWRISLPLRLELSGEFYRGRAVGGLGGGIGQSVLFSGNPSDPYTMLRPLNSAGGWSQIKLAVTPRLEFNGAYGMDNPFAADVRAFPFPVSYYPSVLTANRGEMANVIYRPRSDLLLSGEYRHLRTTQIGGINNADQVNMMMGVLF